MGGTVGGRLVATIDKKNDEQIRVSVKESGGRRCVELRVYASSRPGEEKWPTGKGFLVPLEDWSLFREGLVCAEKELKDSGWFYE